MEMPTPSTQRNPLISEPFDMIVFGGRGDLAKRKLLPALYELDRDNRLPPDGRIIAVSRGVVHAVDARGVWRWDGTQWLALPSLVGGVSAFGALADEANTGPGGRCQRDRRVLALRATHLSRARAADGR